MMLGKVLPPDAITRLTQYEHRTMVEIAFSGWFNSEYDGGKDSAVSRGVLGMDVRHYAGTNSSPTMDVSVTLAVPSGLTRSEAIEHAVSHLESMECFYPGILNDASHVEITYSVERERITRYFDVD